MKFTDWGHGNHRANITIERLNRRNCLICGKPIPIRSPFRTYCSEEHKKENIRRRKQREKLKAKIGT